MQLDQARTSLRQIDDSLFLDLGTLKFVRFEGGDPYVSAILKFNDGTTEAIQGDSVRELHKRLISLEQPIFGDEEPPPTSVSPNTGGKNPSSLPPQAFVAEISDMGTPVFDAVGTDFVFPSADDELDLDEGDADSGFIVSSYISEKPKGWFYKPSTNKARNGHALILAFINAKGSCSVRPFDSETAKAFKKTYGPGSYQAHFAHALQDSVPLFVNRQPNLERDCKERLPEDIFRHLRGQIEQIEKDREQDS